MSDMQGENNSKYTFWMLLSEYTIKIPIMQRDYAQGRKSEAVEAIREELLDSIFNALVTEKNMDFDFVYGTLKGGILYPLDGQQRLTTLYLLHWYLACKEGYIDDAREVLHHFSYETRISSREFCEKLIDLDYVPQEDETPTDYIKNQNIYFDLWDNDPTISHMLVMLDSIHKKFFDVELEMFPLLVRDIDSVPIITFNYLPMENYALTDDLYIKMNARGKNLSDFENFKAKFLQHMKKNGLPYKHFEESVDTSWTDLLWDYRSEVDNTIDEQFMYLFLYFTEMLYLEHSEQQDGNSPFKVTDIRGLISFYDTEEKVEELYDLFDLWKNKEEIDECFDSVFADQYSEGKVRIFDDKHNLIDSTIKENKLKVFNKVILYLFMKRLILFKKKGKSDDSIEDYVRIIRNFVMKVRQRKYESYTPDFRFCRHGIPYISYFLEEFIEVEDIYGYVSEMERDERINNESLKYEKDKADYILKNPERKEYIHQFEDLNVFRTSIHNIMPFIRNRHIDKLASNIEDLFDKDYFELLVRAMLAVNDYGINLGGSYYGERVFYGNREKDWYNILSATDRNDYPEVITAFLNQYYDASSLDIEESLNEIINNNLPDLSKDDWRYYFVKYPSLVKDYPGFIDSPNLIILKEKDQDGNFCVPHRLNGKQLTGYHACALYLEVAQRLSNDMSYLRRGKDAAELSSLLFKSGAEVGITSDGKTHFWYIEEGDISNKVTDLAAELFDSQVTDSLDYIEKLELMCNDVLKAEEELL